MFLYLRYPTKQQGHIWLKRRQEKRPSSIAEELQVSRPFVSKAQRIAETRIKKLLLHTAMVNRIQVQHLSPLYGFAVGYCPAYQTDTYIIYSPKLGVQTWFTHKGECNSCVQRSDCEKILRQFAHEWEIPIPDHSTPTEAALHLFTTIKRRLKWTNETSP